MKLVKLSVLATCSLLCAALLFSGVSVSAQSPTDEITKGVDSVGGTENTVTVSSAITTAVNTFLFLIGAISVVMVIYGGFKYVTSSGESSAVTSAKNTILYAIVGLIIAILAYAIVNFATGIFNGNKSQSASPECTAGANC